MKLTLGFSPCPNDTFIFDALIHQKIDTGGLDFEVTFDDVETLNTKAVNGELDITKLSFHAFAYVLEKYELLDSGSALGFGVGPLLITKQDKIADAVNAHQGSDLRIGIPGKYTTANFLLQLAFPELVNKRELVFSAIEQELLDDKLDAGLIIHENRFTYPRKGLKKIIDLGDYWEKLTGCPIPLGGIMIKRSLPAELKQNVNRLIGESIAYAFAHPKSALGFIRSHAQEMQEDVMYQHIQLYVNRFSENLGSEGKKAVQLLFDLAVEKGMIPQMKEELFLNPVPGAGNRATI